MPSDPLDWSWLRATGEHDDVQLTDRERIVFWAIAQHNGDIW